jgi:hypothetical protein
LLEILALQKRRWVLWLDEFPYLTAVDASLPSQLQKWLDHSLPQGCLLIVAGSSTRMMNDLFLHRAAQVGKDLLNLQVSLRLFRVPIDEVHIHALQWTNRINARQTLCLPNIIL